MSDLSRWTAGLAGPRDPAQPLLTYLEGPARVELSGATTANWVAKNANLLTDGLGGPGRVGLLLPLHWQTVAVLLAGVATGATVVVASAPAQLAGCDAAFTTAERADQVLDAGAEEVLAVSTHPLGAPLAAVPPLVLDHAREVPSYGDRWGGPAPARVDVVVGGEPLGPLPELGLGPADRLLLDVDPAVPSHLRTLLGALAAGAGLVLAPAADRLDLPALAAQEQLTAAAGARVDGVRAV